jgi:hypothetical protein
MIGHDSVKKRSNESRSREKSLDVSPVFALSCRDIPGHENNGLITLAPSVALFIGY